MLDYEGFLEKAREVSYVDTPFGIRGPERDVLNRGDVFLAYWLTGGWAGGTCWSEETYSVDPEPEPDLVVGLLPVLEQAGVQLRHAREFDSLVVRGQFDCPGYYGNHTYYDFKYVPFDEVYDKLVELGYAEPRAGTSPEP